MKHVTIVFTLYDHTTLVWTAYVPRHGLEKEKQSPTQILFFQRLEYSGLL